MSKKSDSPALNQLRSFIPGYVALWFFSFFSPFLYLAGPVYNENLQDRVLLSRNGASLWVLFGIALFLIAMYCVLDFIRRRTLQRIGVALDARLTRLVFDAIQRSDASRPAVESAGALNDLNAVREFLSGPLICSIFDAFWSPIFIVVMFVIHPVYGVFALLMLLLTTVLTFLNQFLATGDAARTKESAAKANELSNSITRNADVARVLGMLPALTDRWYGLHQSTIGWQVAGQRRAQVFSGIITFLHVSQIILVVTVGAVLYIQDEISSSTVMFAYLVMFRALGPINSVAGNWRQIANFSSAFRRIDEVLRNQGAKQTRMRLPRPEGALQVSRLVASAPGQDAVLINDVTFSVSPGRVLGIVGPSGAGKSCLARLLVGIWRPRRGSITLAGHDLSHWDEDDLGRHLGYVPQEVDLLPGTIAENIRRFSPESRDTASALIEAADIAGIQEMIGNLPDGYNTVVGPRGHVLSGGQRQRIAFARAVYGNPALLVLDEPNSNLDAAGEQALGSALERLRAAGTTVVVITHKVSLLAYCDDVLVLNNGAVQAHGARDQIFTRVPRLKAGPSLAVIEGSSEGKRA